MIWFRELPRTGIRGDSTGCISTPQREVATMTYVDAYVAAVLTANRDKYTAYATETSAIFKGCGALRVTECWGDDVPQGEVTSLPMAVQCRDDETVVFGWIEWPSKAVRDAGMQQAMADPRMNPETCDMPFDGMRLIFGGFEVLVQA